MNTNIAFKKEFSSNFIGIKLEDLHHELRVARMAHQFAHFLGYNQKKCDDIYISGSIHDIGKSFIDDSIINKPGKLTAEEYLLMKSHPIYSMKQACELGFNDNILFGILNHHENYDGTGYFGIVGKRIPCIARVLRIIDEYDALRMDRPYRSQMDKKTALQVMKNESYYFDPFLWSEFKRFVSMIE